MSDTSDREPAFDAPPPSDPAWERPTMLVPSQLEHRRPQRYSGRSAIVAIISTLVFVGLIVLVLYTAPNAAVVRHAFFDPHKFVQALPEVARFFLINVRMFLIAEVLILIFALILAVLRTLPGPVFFPVRVLAIVYIDLFRGVPLLLVLFIVGYGLPSLQLPVLSGLSIFLEGVMALTLVYSAYVAEVYRAGIESIHESQTAAARSLGLSRSQSLRYVILPQAVRRVIPPLLNDFIGLQKDTALVSVIGLVEAVRTTQDFATTEATLTSYVAAAMLFILVTIPLARFLDHIIAKDQRRRRAGAVQ